MTFVDPTLAKERSAALVEWLRKSDIPFDEAMPVLAVAIGIILKQQSEGTPGEHLERGYQIACGMIRAAAFAGRRS